MAATRVITTAGVPPTMPARSMCWFQSVTSSARAIDDTKISTVRASTHTQSLFSSRILVSSLNEVSHGRA